MTETPERRADIPEQRGDQAMQKRKLGKDLEVSAIGLGCM
jgi:hypothetical protein